MQSAPDPAELTHAISLLVQEFLTNTQKAAMSALEQAFGKAREHRPSTRTKDRPAKIRRARRSRHEVAELAQRLLAAIVSDPGQTMKTLSTRLNVEANELHHSMNILKEAGHLRSAGERRRTRYYPTASGCKNPTIT
jgi:predicted transcriptional regulator